MTIVVFSLPPRQVLTSENCLGYVICYRSAWRNIFELDLWAQAPVNNEFKILRHRSHLHTLNGVEHSVSRKN